MEDDKVIEWLKSRIDKAARELSDLNTSGMTGAEITYRIGGLVGKINTYNECLEYIVTNKK